MKKKGLVFISCFAAAALTVSPAWSAPQQKNKSKPQKVTHRTAQVKPTHRTYRTPTYRYGSNWRHSGTRYYGGTTYYIGGGFGYPYYGYSYWPYSYYGYYPYSYYRPYGYSYYNRPAYSYDGSMVARVQSRLAELGYYHGAIDGITGPRTRAAIMAYENRHGLSVDGVIDSRLLARMGLA